MWGVFAELERDIITARIKSGMENAKAKGVKLGRPQTTIATLPYNFLKYYPMFQRGSINLSDKFCPLIPVTFLFHPECNTNSLQSLNIASFHVP